MVKISSSLEIQSPVVGEMHISIGVRDGMSWMWNSKSCGGAGHVHHKQKNRPACADRFSVLLPYRLTHEASRLG
jgi:hypothetical protein